MKHVITLLTIIAFLLPSTASAYFRNTFSSTVIPDNRTDPCRGTDGRERERCEARVARRPTETRFDPIKEVGSIHEGKGFDRTRLRDSALQLRLERMQARLEERRTLRETFTEQDHNTTRRTFLNQYRRDRTECMLVAHGRPRRLCLERVQNQVRSQMDPKLRTGLAR